MMVKAKCESKVLNYEDFVWTIQSVDNKYWEIIAENENNKYSMGIYKDNSSDKGFEYACKAFNNMLKAYKNNKRIYEL